MKKILSFAVAVSLMLPVLSAPSGIAAEVKSSEVLPAEVLSAQGKSWESKPVEVKPAELKPATALEQETEAARREIEAAYSRIAAAYARKDIKGVFAEYTENPELIGSDGIRTSKAQEETDAAERFKSVKSIRAWNATMMFTFGNGGAYAMTAMVVQIDLPESEKGKQVVVEVLSVSRDVWVKRGDKWLMDYNKNYAVYSNLDGKLQTRW